MIKILNFDEVGPYHENSIRSLTSSTPVLLAASISRTSICLDCEICSQFAQLLLMQLFFFGLIQLRDFANILAIVVLPTPLIPVNKKAFGILLTAIDFSIASTIISWPISSLKT